MTYSRQHLTVPNNLLGRLFIWYLKRHLNGETYRVVLRGRGFNRRKALKLWLRRRKEMGVFGASAAAMPAVSRVWRYGPPTSIATRLGIYFTERKPTECSWTAAAVYNRRRPSVLQINPPNEFFQKEM